MAGRRITVEFLGKDTSLGKTANDVDGKVGKLSGKFQQFGAKAAPFIAAGFVAAGAAAVKFGNQASDLAETQSKVNQIFGEDGARMLNNFAGAAAKNMGQSKQMALDGAATFGILGKAAGQSGVDLVNFSTRMTVLASDMASFNNTSPEQAIEAIGAALRGESEPIRAYGVMLNEASIKAEALAMGLLKPVKDSAKINSAQATLLNAQKNYNEAVKEHGKNSLEATTAQAKLGSAQSALKKATDGTLPTLTQQQKILATQSLIMKQTSDQQGDFAKTSDGLANKQRIVKAEFENLTTQLGEKALPAMLKVTDWANGAIDWMGKHEKLVGGLALAVGGFATAVWGINAAVKAWTAVQAAFNVVMSANPIGLVIIAIAALAAGLIYAYKHSKTFREIVDGAFSAVSDAASFMWNKVLKPTFNFLVTKFLWVADKIVGAAAWAFGWVPGLGPKLKTAAEKMHQFKTDVNNEINGVKDPKITVTTPGAAKAISSLQTIKTLIWDINHAKPSKHSMAGAQNLDELLGNGRVGNNARGTSSWSGGPTWVGERGPEIVVPPRGSGIIPNHKIGASRGGTVTHVVDLRLNGKTLRKMLLEEKRAINAPLGLA